jgi:hypothetical protein
MAKVATVNFNKLEKKFAETAFRISQERNDFLLPQVIDLVREKKWVNLRARAKITSQIGGDSVVPGW